MSAFSQQTALNLLAATFAQATFTATTAPVKIKLCSVTPTESTPGTEISPGGNYVVGGVSTGTWASPTTQTGAYSGRIGNAAVTIANMPAATVSGIDLVDSAATPRRLMWGALTTPRTLAVGDTLSFPADSIVAQV